MHTPVGTPLSGCQLALFALPAKPDAALRYPVKLYLEPLFAGELRLDNAPQALAAPRYSFVLFLPIPIIIAACLLYTFAVGFKQQEVRRRECASFQGVR